MEARNVPSPPHLVEDASDNHIRHGGIPSGTKRGSTSRRRSQFSALGGILSRRRRERLSLFGGFGGGGSGGNRNVRNRCADFWCYFSGSVPVMGIHTGFVTHGIVCRSGIGGIVQSHVSLVGTTVPMEELVFHLVESSNVLSSLRFGQTFRVKSSCPPQNIFATRALPNPVCCQHEDLVPSLDNGAAIDLWSSGNVRCVSLVRKEGQAWSFEVSITQSSGYRQTSRHSFDSSAEACRDCSRSIIASTQNRRHFGRIIGRVIRREINGSGVGWQNNRGRKFSAILG
mmetsp:Transcript_19088/g.39272  ORF Transcript_19088/g.39272 Transcript_19088/m.39272 type:complete len:285 (-) Transcript_19088:11-865(-)